MHLFVWLASLAAYSGRPQGWTLTASSHWLHLQALCGTGQRNYVIKKLVGNRSEAFGQTKSTVHIYYIMQGKNSDTTGRIGTVGK